GDAGVAPAYYRSRKYQRSLGRTRYLVPSTTYLLRPADASRREHRGAHRTTGRKYLVEGTRYLVRGTCYSYPVPPGNLTRHRRTAHAAPSDRTPRPAPASAPAAP